MNHADPFPTIAKLAGECRKSWKGYALATAETARIQTKLRKVLTHTRPLDADACLLLFGSFARHEMTTGSDLDWAVLVDGVVNANHLEQTRTLANSLADAKIIQPGTSGVFGGMVFSHDLVHFIGGAEDSNENLTRRMLMILESCYIENLPGDISERIWGNVVKNILKRYFEEDVHFRPGKHRVPRFLLNDITRYWRTICVDYAAKHREQDGRKWALRNAKIRMSRKLLFAAGIAFCFDCQLTTIPPHVKGGTPDIQTFIQSAVQFARTPPLEYLARFVLAHVKNMPKRRRISENIFGSYNKWLLLLSDAKVRNKLSKLTHAEAKANRDFRKVRDIGCDFAAGLRELFFDRRKETDAIANLSLDYVGF